VANGEARAMGMQAWGHPCGRGQRRREYDGDVARVEELERPVPAEAAKRGIIKKNTAARKKSRIAALLKKNSK